MTTAPPSDLGAERGLLGSMMLSPAAAKAAVELVRADDFYDQRHAAIFAAIAAALEEQAPTDILAVGTRLADAGDLVRLGGAPLLHDLVAGVPTASSAVWYAGVVAEKAALRRLQAAGMQIAQLAAEPGRDPGDAAALAGKLLADASAIRVRHDLVPVGDLLDPALREIEAAGRSGRPPGLSTGIADLDAMLGGLRPGQLVYVGARPGFGKSVVSFDWAVLAALRARRNVAVFSLEMSAHELVGRLLSHETGVPLARITRGRLTDSDWATLSVASGDIHGAPLYIDDTAPMSLTDIVARARRLHARIGLDMVVVDYLQLVTTGRRGRDTNREQEVAEISRAMKLLAKELSCVVVVAAQLNRGPELRTDHRPHMSDLRESGAVEQDADIIVLLYRPAFYNPDHPSPKELELIVAKHRNGPTGTVAALDDYGHARLYDINPQR